MNAVISLRLPYARWLEAVEAGQMPELRAYAADVANQINTPERASRRRKFVRDLMIFGSASIEP